jgi:site-specific DNA-methyltransferase (adenine-specific)
MPDRFKSQAEYIVWGTNGPRKINMKDKNAVYLPGLFRYAAPNSVVREHSTQKPIGLLEQMVQVARPHEVVFDPFMGSGTTGVACVKLRRRFIGIEIEEKYFDVACKRIEEAEKQKNYSLGLEVI